MNFVQTHLRTLALSTLLAAAPIGSALAQTSQAAVERFEALIEAIGGDVSWSDVSYSGSDAELIDVTVASKDETYPIGNITLSGISEVDKGYRVESISIDDYRVDGEDGAFAALRGVELGGVLLPNEGEQDNYGGFLFYETADVERMIVDVNGVEVLTLTDTHFESTVPEDGKPMEYSGAVEGFRLDLSLVEDASQKAVIQALGYEQLSGYVEMEGSWQPADGRLIMSKNAVTLTDAGTLDFQLDFGGYTPAFIASLREIQQKMAADDSADSSAQGMAALGLMQQLTLHSANLGFIDDSLTDKVIEFVAKGQGVSASDLKNQAKAVVPFALAQLNVPDLTAKASQAISAFLDDPQSLWINAEPASPVPFALIAAEGMSAPQGLVKTLGVTVTSNE